MADPSKRKSEEASDQIKFGHYVVTLIDLLGQRSKLAEWNFFPKTAYDKQKFIGAIRESFARVFLLRSQFEKYFRLWLDSRDAPESVARAQPDGGSAYREYADISLDFMHFSDTIVAYSPVVNQYGHANAGVLFAHMFTCGSLILTALNQGTVFRGAIELGMAGPMDEAGIYGPVLAAVHRLESSVAGYPRILVGDRLHDYLVAQAADSEDSRPAKVNRATASQCLHLACVDLDGIRILDYMSDAFVDEDTDGDGWQMLRDGATAFAERERDRFRESGNQKLAARYEQMCAYHDSRRPRLS